MVILVGNLELNIFTNCTFIVLFRQLMELIATAALSSDSIQVNSQQREAQWNHDN